MAQEKFDVKNIGVRPYPPGSGLIHKNVQRQKARKYLFPRARPDPRGQKAS